MIVIEKKRIVFSIIIPHFRSVDLLIKLLHTIPMQDDIEIYVIDDNSGLTNDERQSIVDAIGDRGKLLFNETGHRGAGVCRNIALPLVTGEWILFADADDYYLPGAFELFREHAGDQADIIYFRPISEYLETGKQANRDAHYSMLLDYYNRHQDLLAELRMRYEWENVPFRMFRASIIKEHQIRFGESRYGNDVLFAVMAGYYARDVEVVDRAVYCITVQDGTLTTTKDQESFYIRAEVYAAKCAFLKEHLPHNYYRQLGEGGAFFVLRAIHRGYGISGAIRVAHIMRQHQVSLNTASVILARIRMMQRK